MSGAHKKQKKAEFRITKIFKIGKWTTPTKETEIIKFCGMPLVARNMCKRNLSVELTNRQTGKSRIWEAVEYKYIEIPLQKTASIDEEEKNVKADSELENKKPSYAK